MASLNMDGLAAYQSTYPHLNGVEPGVSRVPHVPEGTQAARARQELLESHLDLTGRAAVQGTVGTTIEEIGGEI